MFHVQWTMISFRVVSTNGDVVDPLGIVIGKLKDNGDMKTRMRADCVAVSERVDMDESSIMVVYTSRR